jgi:hypothetical protein
MPEEPPMQRQAVGKGRLQGVELPPCLPKGASGSIASQSSSREADKPPVANLDPAACQVENS